MGGFSPPSIPMFGLCHLAQVPVRAEASDRAEMVSQLLFGETFEVLSSQHPWLHIRLTDDGYTGWIDHKQQMTITEEQAARLAAEPRVMSGDLLEFVSHPEHGLMPISMGAQLGFLHHPDINTAGWTFDGQRITGQKSRDELVRLAYMYLHAPYLWGGKTPFGIDCSGFTQMVYKLAGYALLRDASQQAQQGNPLSFIEEAAPGDLAFFDNEEGKIIHVGMLLANHYIIHASGQVRIDRLDHLGIFNPQTRRHTHRLRVIKNVID